MNPRKLRRCHLRTGARRQGSNLRIHILCPVPGIGVVAQELGTARAIFRLNGLKELRQPAWIIPGVIENPRTQQVRLLLVITRHL